MRWEDFGRSDNVEDRRGGGGLPGGGFPGGRGGLGIGGLIVVGLISYFTGINPAVILGGLDAITGGGEPEIRFDPRTQGEGRPSPAEDRMGRFVSSVLNSTEVVWTDLFRESNRAYDKPRLVLFAGGTRSACGTAQSAMGPFYCPGDSRIYLDTSFFQDMRARLRACGTGQARAEACEFAWAYVIAHEVGHHVQAELGILGQVNQRQRQATKVEANRLQVRVELQADCFAGVWANRAQARWKFLEPGDIEQALQTAAAIGDDRLQRQAQGRVVPDSFTHGSSAQRTRWFNTGLKNGSTRACNTFDVPYSQL